MAIKPKKSKLTPDNKMHLLAKDPMVQATVKLLIALSKDIHARHYIRLTFDMEPVPGVTKKEEKYELTLLRLK